MANRKTIGAVLLVVGILLAILALTFDAIRPGGNPGLGYYQITGLVVGVVVAIVGVFMYSRK